MHNPKRGEVPFPFIGEGIVLRFRTIDLAELRSRYGAPLNAKPEYDERGHLVDHFWTILFVGLQGHDPVVITDLLKAGLKKQGTATKVAKPDVDFDDLPFALSDVAPALEDALFMSRWGITAEENARRLKEAADELGAGERQEENPPSARGTTSTTSSESSGPLTPAA